MSARTERPPTLEPDRRSRSAVYALRYVVAILAVSALIAAARHVDWRAAWSCGSRMGAAAPLVLAPYFFVLLADAAGWCLTFAERPTLRALLRIRAASEAVERSLPAGVAFGESIRVMMVRKALGIPLASAAANAIVTKVAILLAQILFIASTLAASWPSPAAQTSPPHGGRSIAVLGLTFAAWVLLSAWLVAMARARPLARILEGLEALGASETRALRWRPAAARADEALSALARLPRWTRLKAMAFFVLGWVALGFENWVILWLMGAPLPVSAAMAIESLASLIRTGFFLLPGALGAQELGYYGLLKIYGVPSPATVAAAFVVVKRAKELLWTGIGYLLLAADPSLRQAVAGGRTVAQNVEAEERIVAEAGSALTDVE